MLLTRKVYRNRGKREITMQHGIVSNTNKFFTPESSFLTFFCSDNTIKQRKAEDYHLTLATLSLPTNFEHLRETLITFPTLFWNQMSNLNLVNAVTKKETLKWKNSSNKHRERNTMWIICPLYIVQICNPHWHSNLLTQAKKASCYLTRNYITTLKNTIQS